MFVHRQNGFCVLHMCACVSTHKFTHAGYMCKVWLDFTCAGLNAQIILLLNITVHSAPPNYNSSHLGSIIETYSLYQSSDT